MSSFKTRRILSIFTTPANAEALTGLTRPILMFHLKRGGVFHQPSSSTFKIINTPDFSVSTCLNSLEGEKDFLWCLNLPRCDTSSLLDALRTFKLASTGLQQRGLAIYSCRTRSRRGRPFNLLSITSKRKRALRTFKLYTNASDRTRAMRTFKL